MDACLLDMLHDARNEDVLAIAQAIDVHLDRVREIAVEEQRVLAEHRVDLPGLVVRIARLDVRRDQARQRAEQVILELRLVADDLPWRGRRARRTGAPRKAGRVRRR